MAITPPPDLLPGPPTDPCAADAKYMQLHAELAAVRAVTSFDRDQLRIYADAFAARQRAIAELRAAPIIVVGSNNNAYTNPLFKVLSQAEGTMDKCLRRLKMNDVERDADISELNTFIDG